MISIANFDSYENPEDSKYRHFDEGSQFAPQILNGAVEYDTLCPVSKLTGHRGSPLSLLGLALGQKQSRLIEGILQDLPVVAAMDIPDDDKLSLLVSRHHSGTLAEQDLVVKQLGEVADVLFPKGSDVTDQVSRQIQFDENDSVE